METPHASGDLLGVEEVASYLGVGPVTIYRWCRQGRLPCVKVGKAWRIRRTALDEFLRQGERRPTLVSLLNSFLTVPDHIIAIAAGHDLLLRLDAAFFQVGEARGGLLVKSYTGETISAEELRAALAVNGLNVAELEAQRRLLFTAEVDPRTGRAAELQRLLAAPAAVGRSIWISFDWVKDIDLDEALRQQEALREVAGGARLVIKTAVLEDIVDSWPPAEQRRAQHTHRGVIWLTEAGLTLSRVSPLPGT